DVIFGQPVAIDGKRELRITGVKQQTGAYQFTVTSRSLEDPAPSWQRHVSATVASPAASTEPPWHDIESILGRCDILSWKPDLTGPNSAVEFGAHWQVVQRVHLGAQEQVARLELPAG